MTGDVVAFPALPDLRAYRRTMVAMTRHETPGGPLMPSDIVTIDIYRNPENGDVAVELNCRHQSGGATTERIVSQRGAGYMPVGTRFLAGEDLDALRRWLDIAHPSGQTG